MRRRGLIGSRLINLNEVKFWLKGDDLSSMTLNGANEVEEWRDYLGSGRKYIAPMGLEVPQLNDYLQFGELGQHLFANDQDSKIIVDNNEFSIIVRIDVNNNSIDAGIITTTAGTGSNKRLLSNLFGSDGDIAIYNDVVNKYEGNLNQVYNYAITKEAGANEFLFYQNSSKKTKTGISFETYDSIGWQSGTPTNRRYQGRIHDIIYFKELKITDKQVAAWFESLNN